MQNFMFAFLFIVLTIFSFFTGELVTFVMLSLVLMALRKILEVQLDILERLKQKKDTQG